jgi:nitrate/TMAO reductase-like tetraheme cytochrome c subunit
MMAKLTRRGLAIMALLFIAIAGFSWNALGGPKQTEKTTADSNSAAGADSQMEVSGQELWSMNCRRCHNIQPSTMYSEAQWDVIVHHMRVRANLTGADQRAIVEFLKSSH